MDKLSLPQEVGLSLVGPSFHPPPPNSVWFASELMSK